MASDIKKALDPIENEIVDFPQKDLESSIQAIIPQRIPGLIEYEADGAISLTVRGKGAEKEIVPTDKLNKIMWNPTQEQKEIMKNGEFLPLKTDRNVSKKKKEERKNKEATILYKQYYADLELKGYFEKLKAANLQADLEPFDFAVCMAASSLYLIGGEYMTISQIHNTITGGKGSTPSENQLRKYKASIEKMRTIQIEIDNIIENKAYPNMKHYKYRGNPMPSESVEGYVNGQYTETILHLLKFPPSMAFALQRGQITTRKSELNAYELSNTNARIWLHNILYVRISDIKNGRVKSNKILLATLMKEENLNITSRNGKSRLKKDIVSLLDHYKKTGYIRGYKIEGDDFRILI